MHILLIEGENIDGQWLGDYMRRYDATITITSTLTLRAAALYLQTPDAAPVDVILLDITVTDGLVPSTIFDLIQAAPIVPIVFLISGKRSHDEFIRTPNSRVFYVKTDVSTERLLSLLQTIIHEVQHERGLA